MTDEQRETAERMRARPLSVGDVIDDGVVGMIAWVGEESVRVVWASEAVTLESHEHARSARVLRDAARDAQLRAELLAPFERLAAEWERRHRNWTSAKTDHGVALARGYGRAAAELRALLPAPAEGSKPAL